MDMYQSDYQGNNNLCNPDITLWMGDLKPDWDTDFIKESFRHFSNDIQNVKMVADRAGRVGYLLFYKSLKKKPKIFFFIYFFAYKGYF